MSRPGNADEAMDRLKQGNEEYIKTEAYEAEFSRKLRQDLKENGQHPFVCIVTCSDSRVIPETVFSLGLGDAFVIRVAGNIIGPLELGSIEYAVEHLKVPLVFVLGHTDCGAVAAALSPGTPPTHVADVVTQIREAIGSETSPEKAGSINIRNSVQKIRNGVREDHIGTPCEVRGGLYHIDTGEVEFFEED